MVEMETSRLSTFLIGNCNVEIRGECRSDESKGKDLVLSISKDATIGISVNDSIKRARGRPKDSIRSIDIKKIEEIKCLKNEDYSFCLLHPKDIDSRNKSLLQEVLKLYVQELPTMANEASGKKSSFLEKCIFDGKYKTLIIRLNSGEPDEVIAALSYQIIPTDMQYAEIPLAVVRSSYQKKGFGQLMYKELSRRLQSVGVLTVFCWADDVSEEFWLKQGFVLVGQVDSKGKACKLSVKADIKKMLCFPGGSKLMVSHLKKDLPSCIRSSVDAQIPNSDAKFTNTIPDGIAPDSFELSGKGTTPPEKGIKRQMWEGSSASLRSKRVRGEHATDNCQNISVNIKNCSSRELPHKILFMNIADDFKKTCLTKIVEDLGGTVTCDGNSCTHIITGQARRTMNFCVALSSGAWVVSSTWLKASFKERSFVGEANYILEDVDYLMKYKCKLRDAVSRARANPGSLFSGYRFCFAKHIQPSMDLSAIIKSSGGNVINGLDESENKEKTIFVACEEDVKDALDASKRGLRVFSSEWLMNCVMKQELDLEAPQFAESL
ncbi:hypothetical protein LUZ63_012446 [Rhynchospora breviuscula]|uniref:N-acetyltransferase n=1 Tax=Rhynchospora breviuscula TaxID=2022672 RepID=A0A9Q0CL02_9POAL|nr:hypothetical protein LUZ63_012446 [Rhynchospora breviuscula]